MYFEDMKLMCCDAVGNKAVDNYNALAGFAPMEEEYLVIALPSEASLDFLIVYTSKLTSLDK